MIRHRPADDLAAEQVHDAGQIEPALIGLDVGDVSEPDLVRRGGGEVPLEYVRGIGKSWWLSVVRARRGRAVLALIP